MLRDPGHLFKRTEIPNLTKRQQNISKTLDLGVSGLPLWYFNERDRRNQTEQTPVYVNSSYT